MGATFLDGCACLGFAVASVFFLKFWCRSADRLFLAFAIAFALLGLERLAVVLWHVSAEAQSYVYLIRLAAFCVLIGGIVAKNRR